MCLGNPLEGLLLVGQLHIRIPTKTKVSTTTKKRIVKEALEIMDTASNSCVAQPTVAILCGDVNLMQDDADACCQLRSGGPDLLTQWHTQTSSAALSGDVLFVRGCDSQPFDVTIGQSYKDRGMRRDCHDFFGVTLSVPLCRSSPEKKPRLEEALTGRAAEASASVSQPSVSVSSSAENSSSARAQEDSETCKEQFEALANPKTTAPPGLSEGASASAAPSQNVDETKGRGPRNALTHGVADCLVAQMKQWYAERIDDDDVSTTWKHLHKLLFKKVRVPYPSDMWSGSASVSQPSASQGDEPADGLPMVVSEEFVAMQVKSVIERREQWLTDNNLPLSTIMIGSQKDEFLAEIKAEYHGSADQQQRQANDKANGKPVPAGKKQRWNRECQRRGGTTQMFHLLSFSGRWDPDFFANLPAPEQPESQKESTRAAKNARSQLRLAEKYDALNKRKKWLSDEQHALLAKLHDGTLLQEANRLTKISGHGRLKRTDGTSVDIGGSTGGLTRAVLYNWTPPNLDDDEFP